MYVVIGMALASAVAGSQTADESGWPTMSAGEGDTPFVCAIDPSSWRRTWGGRRKAVEVCVFRRATIGGVSFTHSVANIEWRCGFNGSVRRTSLSYYRAGEPEPLATQSEGYDVSDGQASPCLSWNDSTPGPRRIDTETFVADRLRAWGALVAPGASGPVAPRWSELASAADSGAACAVALEDLLRREQVAIGRFACVYDPNVHTPYRLQAGRRLQFRHERGFAAARCDLRRVFWSQGDLYKTAEDRTPVRIETNYFGPYARYGPLPDEAVVDLLCSETGERPDAAGSLDDFMRARLAAWATG